MWDATLEARWRGLAEAVFIGLPEWRAQHPKGTARGDEGGVGGGRGEGLVRLGTWLPFEPAAAMLASFTQVAVSEGTARRRTEQAGAAYEAVQTAEVERLERELPPGPDGPAVQQLSVDGAMVPLVGGCWGEAKLLAIGTGGAPIWEDGEWRGGAGRRARLPGAGGRRGPREAAVLATLAELRERAARDGTAEVLAAVEISLGYLEKRRAQLRYGAFRAAGYPIGSGMVESGNKLVTEARLKGAGMHWAPEHVDPLLALRTAVCADRWDEAWGQLSVQLRANAHTPTRARQAERRQARAARAATGPAATPPPPPAFLPPPPP